MSLPDRVPVPARIVHQMPGRLRLSMRERRGDAAYFGRLAQQLAGLDGVHRVRSNPPAASIVVEFEGALEALMEGLRASGLLAFDAAVKRAPMLDVGSTAATQLVSGRELNPMFMAGLGFALFGLLQSLRGRVEVPAMTAFWYAASTFQQARGQMLLAPPPGNGGNDGRVMQATETGN